MATQPVRVNGPYACNCSLCRRHRRARYVIMSLARNGDEPAAAWLSAVFDYLLDVEFELEAHHRFEREQAEAR